ncbi:MAG: DUF2231 domain-containing protein [Bacteroides sp.]
MMNLVHLHPMLVHFPIALALVALLFNLAAYYFKQEWLNKAAIALTVCAALGALISILSGIFFTKPVAGLAASLKEEHVTYALASTLFLVLSSFIGGKLFLKPSRQTKLHYAFTALLLLAAGCIALTGMKGGSIVYDVWLF